MKLLERFCLILFLLLLSYVAWVGITKQIDGYDLKTTEQEEAIGDFIIVYIGTDNKLHVYEWQILDGVSEQMLIGHTAFFDTWEEAKMKAKKKCPYEYEIFCIGW